MIVNKTQTRNFQAVSAIDVVDGTGMAVMYMNAAQNERGELNFSQTIRDMDLYKKNKDEVDADLEAFRKEVLESV